MKKLLLFILISCGAVSCKMISFTSRPGVPVNTFPTEMHGKYLYVEKSNGNRDTHRLVIDSTGARLDDELLGRVLEMGDSLIDISHLGKYYHLNVEESDSTGKPLFYVYPFRYKNGKLYIHPIPLNKKNVRKMNRSGMIESGRRNGEYIMDNDAFKTYCERFLRKKNALIFTKISS